MEHPSSRTLFLSYLSLMILLALTAVATSAALSLAIAALKAGLILAFFMHLRYRPLTLLTVAVAPLLWLFFLFGVTLADYLTRGMVGVPGK